jgi:hypothetical protein
MDGMSEKEILILLRVNRQAALHRFLRDHFIPMLFSRGYSTTDLLQALGGWTFDKGEKITAHLLWDAAYLAKP